MLKMQKENKEIVTMIVKHNDQIHNVLKLCEELNELSTVLLQSVTKKVHEEDIAAHIIEEIGDVKYRLAVFIEGAKIDKEKITQRITHKLGKCEKYIIENRFKNV